MSNKFINGVHDITTILGCYNGCDCGKTNKFCRYKYDDYCVITNCAYKFLRSVLYRTDLLPHNADTGHVKPFHDIAIDIMTERYFSNR